MLPSAVVSIVLVTFLSALLVWTGLRKQPGLGILAALVATGLMLTATLAKDRIGEARLRSDERRGSAAHAARSLVAVPIDVEEPPVR